MKLLEDFYFGNIQPCEYEQSSEVRRKLSDMTDLAEILREAMPNDFLRSEIERAFDKQTELIALCERDAYLAGFTLGVRMMIEITERANR